jgi:hypothetical protein
MKARSYAIPLKFGSMDARLSQLINVAQRALLKQTGREKLRAKTQARAKQVPDDVIGRTSEIRVLRLRPAHTRYAGPPITRQYGRFVGEFVVSLALAGFRTIWPGD